MEIYGILWDIFVNKKKIKKIKIDFKGVGGSNQGLAERSWHILRNL